MFLKQSSHPPIKHPSSTTPVQHYTHLTGASAMSTSLTGTSSNSIFFFIFQWNHQRAEVNPFRPVALTHITYCHVLCRLFSSLRTCFSGSRLQLQTRESGDRPRCKSWRISAEHTQHPGGSPLLQRPDSRDNPPSEELSQLLLSCLDRQHLWRAPSACVNEWVGAR